MLYAMDDEVFEGARRLVAQETIQESFRSLFLDNQLPMMRMYTIAPNAMRNGDLQDMYTVEIAYGPWHCTVHRRNPLLAIAAAFEGLAETMRRSVR